MLASLSGALTLADEVWRERTQAQFSCPAARCANVSLEYNIPTWRYRFFSNWANTRLAREKDSGAWHGMCFLSVAKSRCSER